MWGTPFSTMKEKEENYIKRIGASNEHFKEGVFHIEEGSLVKIKRKYYLTTFNKYGKCLTTVGNLIKGSAISIESAIDKTKYFINMAEEMHGIRYDYSKVEYIKSRVKVEIICRKHGPFMITPHSHLNKQGCYECVRYSRLDWRRLTIEDFIKRASKKHKGLYDYSKVVIKGNKHKVPIICERHGVFKQSPNSHLRGRGCRKCYLENNGYNKGKFIYFAKDRECKLYLIEVYDKEERFLKIGITSRKVKDRFSGDNKLPYKKDLLTSFNSLDSGDIWDKEVQLKRDFKGRNYTPKKFFRGYTECFDLSCKEDLIKYINNLK